MPPRNSGQAPPSPSGPASAESRNLAPAEIDDSEAQAQMDEIFGALSSSDLAVAREVSSIPFVDLSRYLKTDQITGTKKIAPPHREPST